MRGGSSDRASTAGEAGLVTGGWGTHKGRGRQETGADQSAAVEE